ncbi:hypothetical protein NQ318_016940 [Aromia moschata]|uniref:protein disulfide-isomerase n=1 Tax=Aromia moschata TaxID=1265417 RepID=A0AAV8XSC8_9CUCU|nr:hypothetical protein NQ318_016940 [Aromia moschata]
MKLNSSSNPMLLLLDFFKDQSTDIAKAFLSVASTIDDIPFAVTSEDSILNEYEAKSDSIVLFKKFDEGKSVYEGEADEGSIKKFVQTHSLPLLVEFNHETAQKIFGGEIKSHLLLFLSKSGGSFDEVSEAARSVAGPFREQVLFVTIDADEDDHERIMEFFGLQKKEVPAARLIKLEEDMAKYKPETNDLTESIKKFVQNFLDGKLKQHLLSQELPEDWDKEPVKVLVATNFDSVALDTEKDVLVEFYAPWCGHCKQLAPIYDKIGEHFKDNENVVIAKMDAYGERTRSHEMIEYNGPRTFDGLTNFVESGGSDGAGVEEPVEEVAEDDDAARKDEL